MAPLPSAQNPDVESAPVLAAMNDDFDKAENGYAGMSATPKGAAAYPDRAGLARFAVKSVHMRECFAGSSAPSS